MADAFDRFLTLIKARLPQAFVASLEDGENGEEVLRAIACVFSRLAVRYFRDRDGDDGQNTQGELVAARILDAQGSAYATGAVTLALDDATTLGFTLEAGRGLPMLTTPWGVQYEATGWTRVNGQAAGEVYLGVSAMRAGWEGNVYSGMIREWAWGDAGNVTEDRLPFSTGTGSGARAELVEKLRTGAIRIVSSTECDGGCLGTLDLIAQGRGVPRSEGEGDASLKQRARTAPNAITPNGIVAAVRTATGSSDVSISEYWDHGFAWGLSGWGVGAWSRRWFFVVLVPAGVDTGPIQALVNQIKAAGVCGLVLNAA